MGHMKVGELAYKELLGLPMIGWGGIISITLLIATFLTGYLNHRGIRIIPFKYHKPLAYVTLVVAVIHGTIGILSNLGY
jgi:hypothetical protein